MGKENKKDNFIQNDETLEAVFQHINNSKGRNYGIDLLRIIAMLFVVVIHILGYGGILEAVEDDAGKFAMSYLLKIVVYCAVDCYALISGFVYFSEKNKTHKFLKYITLWLQVEFYSVLITLIFWYFYSDLVGIKELVKAIFPVASIQYWYFSAYTGVFFIMPWLNKIVQSLKKEKIKIFMSCILFFSLFVTGASGFGKDPFGLGEGFSFLWIAILYVVGAYIRKCEVYKELRKRKILLIALFLVILTWSWKMGIGKLTMDLFGRRRGEDLLIVYTSPTILGIAVALLLIFANLNVKLFWKTIINFITPAVFGVYLIHLQPLIKYNILMGRFVYIADLPVCLIPFAVFAIAIMIFTLGVFIDKMRSFIFKVLKINKLSEIIDKKMKILLKLN